MKGELIGEIKNNQALTIGLVGCGRWGRYILRDLKETGAVVHVVATTEDSRSNAIEYKADKIFSALNGLSQQLDGYIIATQTIHHYDCIKHLLGSKRPIFVEKPLSADIDKVNEIAKIASGQVFVMHKWLYHPAIKKIKEIVENKSLGKVLNIFCRRNAWGTPQKDVNSVWIHYPHDLSIIYHLLGYIPKPKYAKLIRDQHGNIQGLFSHLEDKNINCHIEHHLHSGIKERNVTIIFENGTLQLANPMSDHIIMRRGHPDENLPIEKIPISKEMPLKLEILAFLGFLNGTSNKLDSTINVEVKIAQVINQLIKIG
ncbi:MAG: putative dehydrogenase [Saprospiraceae bacterium]|jgi:predicted dehydrogenase